MTRPYGAPDLEDGQPRVEDVIRGMIGTTWIDDYWAIRAASDEPDEPENEGTPEPVKALGSDSEAFHNWLDTVNHT